MPPNRFESEVESFLEGSHGDRTHIKRADHPRLHHYAGRYSGFPLEARGLLCSTTDASALNECGFESWIGNTLLDRKPVLDSLVTYPDRCFLSS